MMKSLARRVILCGAVLGAAGCQLLTGEEDDPTLCYQTYEFGNYGCARLVVIVEPPPQPWPMPGYRWDLRAVAAREGTGTDETFSSRADTGAVALRLIRRMAPDSQDTASVWVKAKMLEDPRPIIVGVPLRVFAADSVLHVARFAPVGERAPEDTLRLTLRRIQ